MSGPNFAGLPGFELWVPPKAPMTDKGLPLYEIIGSDGMFNDILRFKYRFMSWSYFSLLISHI